MGVPVVTMVGDTFMGRQGVNYLGKLGLDDLIATDADSYVAAAVSLAENSARLSDLRARLRTEVASKLFDPPSHVTELETAYSEMWRRYRNGEAPQAFRVLGERVLA